jgi:opacity protein-like surface antigen
MKTLLISALAALCIQTAAAAECVRGSTQDLTVTWTGFKTPHKVGVKGQLVALKAKGPTQAKSWQELVLGQQLTLKADGKGINTGDKVRDGKIAKFFFENQKIKAQVVSIDEKKKHLTLHVTLNGHTLENVGLIYKFSDGILRAKGHIDVLDFMMHKQLKALNKACFAKHEGKTWSDVAIGFTHTFSACK